MKSMISIQFKDFRIIWPKIISIDSSNDLDQEKGDMT